MNASRKDPPGYLGIALRLIALSCLLTFSINTAVIASGLVNNVSQIVTGWYPSGLGNSQVNVFSTPEEACLMEETSHPPDAIWSLVAALPNPAPSYNCDWLYTYTYYILSDTIPPTWIPQAGSLRTIAGGAVPVFACPTGTTWGIPTKCCPVNSATITDGSAAGATSCTCNEGYLPDSSGTSCILPSQCVLPNVVDPKTGKCGPVSTCPISDLPSITDPEVQAYEDNPDLSDTARLQPEMQKALKCLTDHATALGCTPAPSVGSAYRPPAYNQHLIDLWKKWRYELMDNENPICAARKAKIQGDFKRHKLLITQPPVPNSRHTQGLAVDVTINLPPANIKILARGCGLIRPKPVEDPVHFQFP